MIRRTINIPVLVLSVLVLAAGAGGCYFLREWQLARLSQLLLVQARQEEARSDWPKAARHLERYLRLQPHNQAARTQLALAFGKAAATLDEKQRAVALHFRALASELGNQEDELRLGLAELLLETGRLLEAENEAQRVLAAAPQQPRANRTFALARYFQWRSGALSSQRPTQLKLLQTVEDALARNPGDIPLSEIAATLYREFPEVVAVHRAGLNQLSRQQAADRLIDQVVQHQPRDAKAYLSRHVYRAKYSVPGHEDDLAKALAIAPDDPAILIVAARAHCQAAKAEYARPLAGPDPAQRRNPEVLDRELAAARRMLERLIDKDQARTLEPHLLLGDVRVMQDDLDAGIRVWRRALTVHDRPIEQVACHARIADHLLGSGRVDESFASLQAIDLVLARLGGTVTRQHHLGLMQAQGLRRATYFLASARYSDAVGEVQQAIARQPQLQPDQQTSYRAWDLMGRGFAGLEDWTAAATAFDRAANFDPQAIASRLGAARSWLSAGRADLAVDRAEQALLAQQTPEALILLVAAQLQIQAALPPLERSWERMQSALAALERLDPAAVEAPWRIDFLKADYFALRSPTADNPNYGAAAATEVVRLAESKYEKGSQFWFEACLAYERLGNTEYAERAWERLNQLPDGGTQATIAASRRAAVHDNFAQAARILEDAGARASPTAKRTFRQELIRIAQAKQDLSQLKQLLLAELVERPRDVGVLCRLAELELRAGEQDALAGYEKKLAAAGPLGEVWALYFHSMRLYSSAKDAADPALQEALALQAQLATLRPNWSESFSLRGAIEQRLGRLAPAVAAYEQAIALGERRYAVFEQLIACLDQLNRPADVEKYLARMETYLPSSQRLTEIATQHQIHRDQPEKAVELARRAVAQRPADLAAQLWLGRMLLLTNQLEEARQVFEKATQQSPQDVRSWNGLFTWCLRAGDKPRARQVLDAVRANAKLDPVDLDLFLGQAYLRLGESAEALRLFAALKEQAPNRADIHLQLARLYLETDREKAREFLQQAIELDPKLAQARWLLAAILAAGGSEAELAQAEQLLDGAGDGAAVEDRRVRALLLAQHGDADGLVRAVQILEQIIAEGADTSNDHMLLAQFYERQAQATPDEAEMAAKIKAARDQLVNLASRSRAQVGDVAVLVAFLLRQEEKLEAGVWLDRLEEHIRAQGRDDVRAIAQLIDLRIKHGTLAQAEPWIVRLESNDRDPVRPLVARVRYMVALGKTDQVEPLIEGKAKSALDAIVDSHVRTRIARAIGDLYLLANLLPGAERWYRVVLREDKDQFPVLALTLMRQHRAREAIRLCEAATDHDTSSRPAVMLTQILLEAGGKAEHLEMAEPMLEAALKKFPEDANLLYGVGMLRVLADRYPEAIPLLRKVIALNPRHVPALNNLAVIVAETPDQRDEALKLVEQAIDLRGEQATLLDTKGAILVLIGRSSEALSLLEAASRGKNSDPRHKFHLALAYLDMGAAQQAGKMLSDALAGKLENHILTPTDRKSLTRLQSEPAPPTP